MKALDIAFKDLLQSFRSLFGLAFMLGIPILVTVLFFVMFGGSGDADGNENSFDLPVTKVQVVNLDQAENAPQKMGEMVVEMLKNEGLAEILEVTEVQDAAGARSAVNQQAAGVAVIIPANFTQAVIDLGGSESVTVEVYQDPTLSLGPNIVKGVVRGFMDGFSGTRISVQVANEQLEASGQTLDAAQISAFVGQYVAWAEKVGAARESALLSVEPPPGQETQVEQSFTLQMVSMIQVGMMIFYAFFTGVSGAQTILTEEEQGTLPRLFSTPTPVSTILSGKFLAIGLTILVQVIVLVLFGRLVFGIHYGNIPNLTLAIITTVLCAGAFGIFIISWIQNTRQAGAIYGGVVTLTGMLGMIDTFTGGTVNTPQLMQTMALLVPQGWVIRVWRLSMDNAAVTTTLLTALVVLVWAAVFFVIGRMRFQKRYV